MSRTNEIPVVIDRALPGAPGKMLRIHVRVTLGASDQAPHHRASVERITDEKGAVIQVENNQHAAGWKDQAIQEAIHKEADELISQGAVNRDVCEKCQRYGQVENLMSMHAVVRNTFCEFCGHQRMPLRR